MQGVEIVHCKCGIEMYPMTGVIIRCKRFGPYGKAHIKISYYYYYYNSSFSDQRTTWYTGILRVRINEPLEYYAGIPSAVSRYTDVLDAGTVICLNE